MNERIRIAALIINDDKLLLVKGSDKYKEFWTPGGKREDGESDQQCLARELDEEINVKLVSEKFIGEYKATSPYYSDTITITRAYIVKISGEIKVAKEIKSYVWMSRKEFDEEKYPLIETTKKEIIPDLIRSEYF